MARTKQTARKSTGGKCPRKKLARRKDIKLWKNNGNTVNDGATNSKTEEVDQEDGENPYPVEELTNLLAEIKDEPGSFATDGILKQSPLPGLNIEGVGPVCLPLCADSAKRIIEVARQAPFGLGEKTVVDENIRKSWEIDPKRITLKNPRFQSALKALVFKVQQELGCGNNNIRADLYKLLLYEVGGHFKPHKDSEKQDGMFATLIVQLPSVFSGNQLIIRHGGKTHTVDFGCDDAEFSILYAAHYADCEHEVIPLIEGHRLALIYNLVWTAPSEPPNLDQNAKMVQKLSTLLKEVEREHDNVYGWSLEHQYSASSLANGMAALKGKDRQIARSLSAASEEMNPNEQTSFYLMKLERHLNESGDHCGGGYYGRSDYSDGEFEACEIMDDETEIKEVYDFEGEEHDLKHVCFDIEEDLLDFEEKYDGDIESFWGEHDSEEVEGPTGNEGSSRDRWYSSYIILAIPESQKFKLLCQSGIKESLQHLSGELESSSPKFKDHLRTFLTKFKASAYKDEKPYSRQPQNIVNKQPPGRKSMTKVMSMLEKTRDPDLTNLFIKNVLNGSKSSYSYRGDGEIFSIYYENIEKPVADLLKSVSWESIKEEVESVIVASPINHYLRWMKAYNHNDITEIAHKIIELSLQKVEKLTGEEFYPLWGEIFSLIFNNELFGTRWWDSIMACTQIISNLPLLSHLCSRLSPENQTKFPRLFNGLIDQMKQPATSHSNDTLASNLFSAIKQIIENLLYKRQLQELCDALVTNNKLPVIGLFLGLLLKDKQSCTDSEAFKLFLSAYMSWMDNTTLNESNLKEIVNIANVVYQSNTPSNETSAKYIASCKKIANPDLLCMTLNELFAVFKEKNVPDHSIVLKSLLDSLLNLITLQPLRNAKSMSALILLIFEKGKTFEDILCKFIATKYVSNSMETLGNVLATLCTSDNKETLRPNNNFQAILGLYTLLLQNGVKPDLKSYSATLTFLFKDESWSLSLPLLPTLLEIDFIKKDFKNCAFSISQVPSGIITDNFKKLLNTGVDSLELFLVQNKTVSDPDYKVVLGFVQVLFDDLTNFGDIVLRFISIAQLKINDYSDMSAPSSVLKRLINDLKPKHVATEMYAKLLLVRVSNLQLIQSFGQPKLSWVQPNAILAGHPTVQQFLRSPREDFAYRNFNGIAHARNWASKHQGYHPQKGYSFRASTHGTGRNATAQLRKGREFYSLKLKAYQTLMTELEQLQTKLKAFPNVYSEIGDKRPATTPLSNISNIPPSKKVVIEID